MFPRLARTGRCARLRRMNEPIPDALDESWLSEALPRLMERFAPCRTCPTVTNASPLRMLPGRSAVVEVLDTIANLLFPGCHSREPIPMERFDEIVHARIVRSATSLRDMVAKTMAFLRSEGAAGVPDDIEAFSRDTVASFVSRLAEAREVLGQDIRAAYEGDPAARSEMEVVMSYPGVYAVAVHRIAHILHSLGVPILPRIMSEHAHSLTGIDIHPGATIGSGFFIDHGTGVVIGETCVIGRRVKLSQGVTLGALSFAKDAEGHLVKGIKRHPDVEDNVIVYAGATILGGGTVIGHDSVIGGNVWLTHSVPPFSKVYNQQPEPRISSQLVWEGPMI